MLFLTCRMIPSVHDGVSRVIKDFGIWEMCYTKYLSLHTVKKIP